VDLHEAAPAASAARQPTLSASSGPPERFIEYESGHEAAMRTLALAVGFAVVLAAPAAADAKTWRGKTKQGRAVTVETGADDLVNRARVSWRAPCKEGHYVSRTLFQPPFDVSETDVFEHSGTYRKRLPDGYRARSTVFVRGRLGADDRWTGTFRVRTRVRRNGRLVDTCRIRGVRWSAEAS
jgi:opacity protein-like surface antigen